ncbi:hypothetical protein [Persephonella sp.]|uniref:hypothetical protein n=1 Tax=Persephonella sp. TaxID=2060922 RepID=UPI002625C032|nr:hypothetical protein [Persephonella sp.]
MQKFSVATRKGLIHTTDFKSACRILQFELEQQKKRKSQQTHDWDKEFQALLDNYIPNSQKEIEKMKGGQL